MITVQKCPKCRSPRIRKGYKRTPLLFRLVGIHHLLCDHCNLLFTGFAIPGTLRGHRRKKETGNTPAQEPPEIPITPSADLS
jgi:hypothetical protein